MENLPLISIIIPVYNVKQYLDKCVKSVLKQSYCNIEILLIDDGSNDGSELLCDKIMLLDDRIKVFHKRNGGLSDARNYGINFANGKYVTFIDSDDTIEGDYIEVLYNLLKKYNTDMSIASYSLINGNNITNKGIKYCEKELNTKECLTRMLMEEGFNVSSCAKMYSIELFDDIKFPKGKLYEDNATTYKLIMKCERIAYSNKSIYNYIVRKNSITSSEFSINKMDYIYMTDIECEDIIKKYPELIEECESRKVVARFSVLRQMLNTELTNEEKIKEKEIIEYLKKNYKKILNTKKTSKRIKLSLILLLINKKILKVGANIYERFK